MRRVHAWLLLGVLMAKGAIAAVEPKILYEEDPTLLTSTIQVVVLTGIADDPPAKAGLTHLLSEIILRGTKKRTRQEFQSEVERLGASVAVRVNTDSIIFVSRVIKENTNKFLKLLEDFLLYPAFSKQEFDSLKRETEAEIANFKNSNTRLAGLALRREIFVGTPLEHPSSGTLSTIQSVKLEDVVRSYNNSFHRGNMVFAISSPLKEAAVKSEVSKIWLKFPDGVRLSRRYVTPQVPKMPKLLVVNKPDASSGAIFLGQQGIVAKDPLRYTLAVGNFSFGGELLVSRLFRTIRSELGWTYAIFSSYSAMGNLSNQQGIYSIVATPSIEFASKSLLKMINMWKEFLSGGLNSTELATSHDSMINSYPFEFDSADKRLGQKLYSYLYDVPILSPEEYAKTIRGISNGKLVQAFQERQSPEGWVIAIVADSKLIEKQLAEEQKDIPQNQRLTISKTFNPEEIIE